MPGGCRNSAAAEISENEKSATADAAAEISENEESATADAAADFKKEIMKKNISVILVFLSAVFFATGGLFFKFIDWEPLAINSARSLLAGSMIFICMLIKKHKFVINKSVILAAFGICATNNLYALANKMTTAGNTIVLQFSMPVFVILIMWLCFKKKPKGLDLGVCAAVLCGIILFFVDSLSSGGMIGNILALISGLTYAAFFIFNAREDSEPFTAILLAYAMSALIGMPWLVQTDFAGTDINGWLCVIGLGLLQQGTAQMCFAAGIKHTSAVTAALISGIEPVLNPVLVAIFAGEMLKPLAIVGAVLVLVSIVVYNVINALTDEKEKRKKAAAE